MRRISYPPIIILLDLLFILLFVFAMKEEPNRVHVVIIGNKPAYDMSLSYVDSNQISHAVKGRKPDVTANTWKCELYDCSPKTRNGYDTVLSLPPWVANEVVNIEAWALRTKECKNFTIPIAKDSSSRAIIDKKLMREESDCLKAPKYAKYFR